MDSEGFIAFLKAQNCRAPQQSSNNLCFAEVST
jgi:hypothetical protein